MCAPFLPLTSIRGSCFFTDFNTSLSGGSNLSSAQLNISGEDLCGEALYYDINGSGVCRPICGEFLARNDLILKVIISFGFATSVLMLIVVPVVQRKTMYASPSLIYCIHVQSLKLC